QGMARRGGETKLTLRIARCPRQSKWRPPARPRRSVPIRKRCVSQRFPSILGCHRRFQLFVRRLPDAAGKLRLVVHSARQRSNRVEGRASKLLGGVLVSAIIAELLWVEGRAETNFHAGRHE